MCQVCTVKINIKVEARCIVKIDSKVEVRCLECVKSAL